MMKKILFIVPTLNNGGGTYSSLNNLLSVFPRNLYIIHILSLTFTNKKELHGYTVLNPNLLLGSVISDLSSRRNIIFYLIKILLKFSSLFQFQRAFIEFIFNQVANKYTNYDTIIAFQEGFATTFASKMKCDNKISWIHCDFTRIANKNRNYDLELYNKFKTIICVSKYTQYTFTDLFPELKDHTRFIYNILNIDMIKSKSKEFLDLPYDENKFIFLSIGRIDPVKQFSLIPQVLFELVKYGINFQWYLIGDIYSVCEWNKLKENLQKYNIPDNLFIYLGHKDNPYPYIVNSDALVILSSSEACPYVINEARVLDVPVISNNFPSASEFVKNGKNGIICSMENLASCLISFCKNQDVRNNILSNIREDVYSNEESLTKIIEIL